VVGNWAGIPIVGLWSFHAGGILAREDENMWKNTTNDRKDNKWQRNKSVPCLETMESIQKVSF
jgi:hypothetical protein